MKHFFQLTKSDLPLKVKEYNTAEGTNGFILNTQSGERVVGECGSYGYDTCFDDEEEAQKTAHFFNTNLNLA